jgi:two-component system response regulator DevR
VACRVLVVSAYRVVRDGLVDLLREQPEEFEPFAAASVVDARHRLTAGGVDVVLLDCGPAVSEDVRSLREVNPGVRIVVVSRSDDPTALYDALVAGASGFAVYGVQDLGPFVTVVRQVCHGHRAVCPVGLHHLIETYRQHRPDPSATALTPRERELLDLVAGGATLQGAARAMYVSVSAAKKHAGNIKAKLGVPTLAAATARVYGGTFRNGSGPASSSLNGSRRVS